MIEKLEDEKSTSASSCLGHGFFYFCEIFTNLSLLLRNLRTKAINRSSLYILMHWMSWNFISCCQPSNYCKFNVKFTFTRLTTAHQRSTQIYYTSDGQSVCYYSYLNLTNYVINNAEYSEFCSLFQDWQRCRPISS